MTVEQNLSGGRRPSRRLGILFSYGFMLFDPSSTFQSIRENIGFLRKIVGDGSAARDLFSPHAALRRHADPRPAGARKAGCAATSLTRTTISSTCVINEYHGC